MPYGINPDPAYAEALRQAKQNTLDILNAWKTGYSFSLESLARPFVGIDSFRTPRVPPTPAPVEPEAFIRWGGPSAFSFKDSFRDLAIGGVNIKEDDDPNEPPELT